MLWLKCCQPIATSFMMVILSGLLSFFIAGCRSQDIGMTESGKTDLEDIQFVSPGDFDSKYPTQAIKRLKDAIEGTMLPLASGKNKAELNDILEYLNRAEKSGPEYFDDPKRIIEFLSTGGRASVILAELHPNHFVVNRNVSSYYINAGQAIEGFAQSEEGRRMGHKFKASGIQSAKELVKKFPDTGLSYAQLAFALSISGGDKKRIADLFKRCVDLDAESAYCRNSLEMALEEIRTSGSVPIN